MGIYIEALIHINSLGGVLTLIVNKNLKYLSL